MAADKSLMLRVTGRYHDERVAEIWTEPAAGGGTVFAFRLPAAHAERARTLECRE